MTSVKPYLVRALIDWIVENEHTPYLVIDCGKSGVQAPAGRAKDGKQVLNVSAGATRNLAIGNEWLDVDCRFGGASFHVRAPIPAVTAVYSRESGMGMAFEPEGTDHDNVPPGPPKPRRGGPKLTVVK